MARTTVRAPMPASRRAKQFAPFDALKGLKEAIAEKERIPTPRRILAEDALAEGWRYIPGDVIRYDLSKNAGMDYEVGGVE